MAITTESSSERPAGSGAEPPPAGAARRGWWFEAAIGQAVGSLLVVLALALAAVVVKEWSDQRPVVNGVQGVPVSVELASIQPVTEAVSAGDGRCEVRIPIAVPSYAGLEPRLLSIATVAVRTEGAPWSLQPDNAATGSTRTYTARLAPGNYLVQVFAVTQEQARSKASSTDPKQSNWEPWSAARPVTLTSSNGSCRVDPR